MRTSVEPYTSVAQGHAARRHLIWDYLRTRRSLAEGLFLSLFFASVIAFGHAYLFDIRLNSRMVLQPWLLWNGFVQYQHIADEHAPLLPQLLAWLLPVFHGDALLTARVVHALLIGSTVFGGVLWARRVSSRWAAIATGAFFLAWSTLAYWAMWYDLALAPVYLVLFFLMSQDVQGRPAMRLGLAGLVTGLAILIKQQALVLVIILPIWLIWQYRLRRVSPRQGISLSSSYFLGLAIPVVAYLGYYYRLAGTFQDLLYWSLSFNLTGDYRSLGQLAPTADQIRQVLPAFLMVVPFVAGLVSPQHLQGNTVPPQSQRIWLMIFLILAILMLYPRYSTMHWAVALSFIALISGIACADLVRQRKDRSPWPSTWGVYLAVVLLWTLSAVFTYSQRLSHPRLQNLIEFSPLVDLADQLKSRNLPDEGIVLFPDDEGVSNLYYLLQRQPPKFWMMNYPWFINPYTIARWVQAMETERPQTLIFFPGRGEYEQYAPEMIEYIQSRYQAIETLDWGGQVVQIMTRFR